MVIAGVFYRALSETIRIDDSCIMYQSAHLKVSNGGLSWGRDMSYSSL